MLLSLSWRSPLCRPPPHSLASTPVPSRRYQEFNLPRNHDTYLPRRILCCSGKKSRRRALKSNEELRDELREFMSTMGLPEGSLPSLKELCENGRKDLANIVRRRGYKAITELLLNSTGENHISERNLDSINADSIASTEFEGLQFSKNPLHMKADKFVQTGELDTIEGEDSRLSQDFISEALEEDNENEVDHLKSLLEQKEKELSQLKQQIEYEKLALRNLQARAKAELSDIQRSTAKKDEELCAVEECLNGLKEVHIEYWTNGQIVELAGSFNGWQHRVKMNLHPSSEHTNLPGTRAIFRWTIVLWLYPGVYEIKFIVDGDWRIDSQREIIAREGITNNVLRVDG